MIGKNRTAHLKMKKCHELVTRVWPPSYSQLLLLPAPITSNVKSRQLLVSSCYSQPEGNTASRLVDGIKIH